MVYSIGMIDGGKTAHHPDPPGTGPACGYYDAWLLPEPGVGGPQLAQPGLTVGMLIPDGASTSELVAPGYARQPIILRPCLEGALAIGGASFGAGDDPWPVVWGAAIFNASGMLLARGPLTRKSARPSEARLTLSGVVVVLNPEHHHG